MHADQHHIGTFVGGSNCCDLVCLFRECHCGRKHLTGTAPFAMLHLPVFLFAFVLV